MMFFSFFEAAFIKNIPLPSTRVPDKRVWSFAKNRKYTVRSGYKFLLHNDQNRTSFLSNVGRILWTKIWSLKIPRKILGFLWKFQHNIIPSFAKLCKRHIAPLSTCCR